jgi:hypothetical protein
MNGKKFYLSRMLWLNAITLILAILALPELISLLPVSSMPYIALANAVGNMILRLLTTEPLK